MRNSRDPTRELEQKETPDLTFLGGCVIRSCDHSHLCPQPNSDPLPSPAPLGGLCPSWESSKAPPLPTASLRENRSTKKWRESQTESNREQDRDLESNSKGEEESNSKGRKRAARNTVIQSLPLSRRGRVGTASVCPGRQLDTKWGRGPRGALKALGTSF